MKFKNVRQVETGLAFDVECSNQEVSYLVNWAVERLLQEGILSINSSEPEQEVQFRETAH